MTDWWEKGKLLLKECLKNLSIEINKSSQNEILTINNKISSLLETDLEQNKFKIASLKSKLQELYNIKNEGARIRSRLKNIENEILDKFFFKNKLKNENNEISSEPKDICSN